MIKFYRSYLVFLFFICAVGVIHAQPLGVPDPVKRYLDTFGKTLLYHGKQYVDRSSGIASHQGYITNNMTEGCMVHFDGLVFDSIPLMYDLTADEVVTRHPDRYLSMILSSELVSLFTIGADTFVHLKEEGTGLVTGFYQQIFHSSEVVCYAKRSKTIKVLTTERERRYVEQVRFYLKRNRDSKFHLIGNQRALLSVFKDERRELRKLLNLNGLSFADSPEQTIEFVLKHVTN